MEINDLDPTLTLSEQINLEKRKRYQTYMALDYMLGVVTYFDFFSLTTFNIVKRAKHLAQICENNVTSELLLLPFFKYSSDVSKIFQDLGITESTVTALVENLQEKKRKSISRIFKEKFGYFFGTSQAVPDMNIQYSYEVNQLFEKAAQNALLRFKTPVISPEILFVTMAEEKNTRVGKLIGQLIKDETEWYLMRYKLIKRLHSQEVAIKGEVKKNQRYFAYLMKTQFTDSEFNKLVENEALPKGVSFFRNQLVSQILQENIFDKIDEEITVSIKLSKKRKYFYQIK